MRYNKQIKKHRIRHQERWFMNRIGKYVRNKSTNEGGIIIDECHAHYLFLCQNKNGLEYTDCRTLNEKIK